MEVQALLTQGSYHRIRNILTWTAPAIAIPALRFTQDSHQQRKELFVRDASTYAIGALIFLGTEYGTQKILNRFPAFENEAKRNLTAFLLALTANLLYAGIGAVRFSKAFSRYQAQKNAPQITPKQSPIETSLYRAPTLFPSVIPGWQHTPIQPPQRMQYLA